MVGRGSAARLHTILIEMHGGRVLGRVVWRKARPRVHVPAVVQQKREPWPSALCSVGYEIIEARDGARGVKAAKAERPDLILINIQLPVLDGYEATRQIKADPELQAIPIVVVTSYALSGDALARADEVIE